MITEILNIGGNGEAEFVSSTGYHYILNMKELDDIFNKHFNCVQEQEPVENNKFNHFDLIAQETGEYLCDLKLADDAVERLIEIGLIKVLEDQLYNSAKVEKVHFNDPYTIVFFSDGEKVIVKTSVDDIYDEYMGVAMAIVTHLFGTRSQFRKFVNEKYKEDYAKKSFRQQVQQEAKCIERDQKLRNRS